MAPNLREAVREDLKAHHTSRLPGPPGLQGGADCEEPGPRQTAQLYLAQAEH